MKIGIDFATTCDVTVWSLVDECGVIYASTDLRKVERLATYLKFKEFLKW